MLRWRHRNRLIKLMDGWLRRLRGVVLSALITAIPLAIVRKQKVEGYPNTTKRKWHRYKKAQ